MMLEKYDTKIGFRKRRESGAKIRKLLDNWQQRCFTETPI